MESKEDSRYLFILEKENFTHAQRTCRCQFLIKETPSLPNATRLQRVADTESNHFTSALSNLGFRFFTLPFTYRNLKFRIRSEQSGWWNFGHRESSFMSELDAQIPTAFDPFAEANADDSGVGQGVCAYSCTQRMVGKPDNCSGIEKRIQL
ncbi:uncharacterized protein [Phaseolus vulgaris]|uniref:uncharacterized protein n=1 Tax=Phaseolus vulgaris TaxID=3885 RepID=UPI0035C9604E